MGHNIKRCLSSFSETWRKFFSSLSQLNLVRVTNLKTGPVQTYDLLMSEGWKLHAQMLSASIFNMHPIKKHVTQEWPSPILTTLLLCPFGDVYLRFVLLSCLVALWINPFSDANSVSVIGLLCVGSNKPGSWILPSYLHKTVKARFKFRVIWSISILHWDGVVVKWRRTP